MQKQNKNLKCAFTIDEPNDDWKGLTGLINGEMIKKEIPDYKETIFYLCGPPGMVNALKGIINQIEIPSDQIRVEFFTGYT
jgi:ferredoxin-NADP reductase